MQTKIQFIPPWQSANLPKETPVLLAFSGGADSTALLHLLWEHAKTDGYPLILAHVNHGIRGEEALRDRAFCQRMAQEYGLEICFADVDVPSLAAKNGRSLEEEAREVRYAFFASLMKERKIPLLATAHHADDNLETLLFRLSRGTSLRGLCGIAPIREFYGVGCLTRPLLRATRSEILRYCAEMGLEYVTDSTNLELSCSRNKLRGLAVPVLEELFADPQHRATELCDQLRQDEDFLSDFAVGFLSDWKENGCLVAKLHEAHPAILQRVLDAYVVEQTGVSPHQVHLRELLKMVDVGHNGMRCSLPGNWSAVIEQDRLRLVSDSSANPTPFRMAFSEGVFHLPHSEVVITVEKDGKNTKVHNLSTASYIILKEFSAIMDGTLFWRSRGEGDTILMGGMTRKLRKLYNQKKIPPRLREQLPLLCDKEGVLWAPFLGIRDGVQLSERGILVSVKISDVIF